MHESPETDESSEAHKAPEALHGLLRIDAFQAFTHTEYSLIFVSLLSAAPRGCAVGRAARPAGEGINSLHEMALWAQRAVQENK